MIHQLTTSLQITKQKVGYVKSMKMMTTVSDEVLEDPVAMPEVDPWLLNGEVQVKMLVHRVNLEKNLFTGQRRLETYRAFEKTILLEVKKVLNGNSIPLFLTFISQVINTLLICFNCM